MPVFSIIVPVYNAQNTLHKCLDSLVTQTFGDFEVHMIENGSSDASNAICKEYVLKDPRFLLHSCAENCGPSGARNIGLDKSIGQFIAFVDSDDFVQPEYLESLYDGFEDADVVFLGYNKVNINGKLVKKCVPQIPDSLNYHEILLRLANQDMYGYTWVKAFRKDVIGEHRFSEKLNLMEDEVFTNEILSTKRRLAVVTKQGYNYMVGNNISLMGRTHNDYCRKADVAFSAWQNLLAEYENKENVLADMANSYVQRCMYYCYERDVNIKDFCTDLAESLYFNMSTVENDFARCVKNKRFDKIKTMKVIYNVKNMLTKHIKR